MNDPQTVHGEYQIRRLSEGRLTDLRLLFQAVYNREVSREFFTHKYNTAYTWHEYIGFIAFDKQNTPVAFFGAIPCFIKSGDRLILSAQAVDAMTLPGHRDQALFTTLANLTIELCAQEDIRLVFGFPNQYSEGGLIKMGWQTNGYMERFTFPIKTFPLEKITAKNRFLHKLYQIYVHQVLKKNLLSQSGFASDHSDFISTISRDSDYLHYKSYYERFTIKAGNETVWFKIRNGLIIGDISCFGDNFLEVLDHLKKLSKKLGVQQIHFQVPQKSPAYYLLQTQTDPLPSFPIMVKDLGSGIDLASLQFAFADIDIF